MATETMKGRS